ncbi:uncharacterized protein SPPG_09435 [Spizellomyces punctatus DAOM BR117]|uniref:Essential for reactive oxygen species protein n=1 Tax=Spizellomyces punctatus (strain DAOM BR117) TaxID=645134 RepID=A0A0L0H7Y9_SPIPD|nr:uncharacterized protein SPPG_09435 [Spizellomyces punctatus DAOM BR117]KNC97630.1 hypothetical protein SPPG_09435 [Spizellomyces punctatus DAOM BR117]|eukprot:XP_016605670.1 hypothetical protein SPPG_09435 [Spizellomyces punctatus DAOM BR117]
MSAPATITCYHACAASTTLRRIPSADTFVPFHTCSSIMFSAWKTINPRIVRGEGSLSITPVTTGRGDVLMMAIIFFFGVAMTLYTTEDLPYRIAGSAMYAYLAWTLVVDTYETVFDKQLEQVSIIKTTLGFKRWSRVAPLDELVAIETTTMETTSKKQKPLYRLELEFYTTHGTYRMPMTETYVSGEHNKEKLEEVEDIVRKFAEIKKLPNWMKEEELEKRFGAGKKQAKTRKKGN